MEIARIFDLLDQFHTKYPDLTNAIAGKTNGSWKKYSDKEYAEIVNSLSKGLLNLGVVKGDKIATIVLNSPEKNCINN